MGNLKTNTDQHVPSIENELVCLFAFGFLAYLCFWVPYIELWPEIADLYSKNPEFSAVEFFDVLSTSVHWSVHVFLFLSVFSGVLAVLMRRNQCFVFSQMRQAHH